MKRYSAIVKFMKGANSPEFAVDLNAPTKELAIQAAKWIAKENGFHGQVKTVSAKEIKEIAA
jgi:hypothetical protein